MSDTTTDATATPEEGDPFEWFPDGTMEELRHQLAIAGAGCRLRLYAQAERPGHHLLQVVPRGMNRAEAIGAGYRPLNKSHICPPDC